MSQKLKRPNGIQPERYDFEEESGDVEIVRGINLPCIEAYPVALRRNPNGQWTLEVLLDIQILLEDWRELTCEREISVGAILQRGRKPRKRSA